MTEHKSHDMVLRYLTPDLVDMKQEELILEIIWLRYCLDFQEAFNLKKEVKVAIARGKSPVKNLAVTTLFALKSSEEF